MEEQIRIIKNDNSDFRIFLPEKIDFNNSVVLSDALEKIAPDEKTSEIVFDADKLVYISSSGLRALLTVQKKFEFVRIENVCDSVYETFSITGFTEMMTVTKKLREISTDGLTLLGKGGTASVYRLDEDRIVKVFSENIDFRTVLNEQRGCRSAFKAGIPTAIPYELARVGKSYAAVTELVQSSTLTETLAQNPDNIEKNIDRYADFVTGLNDIKVSLTDFRSMKRHYLDMVDYVREYLDEDEYSCFTGMINDIPDGNGFVHGDCHAGNIMCQNGDLLLIDMATAGYGNWFFELFCIYFTYVLVAGMSDPEQSLGLSRDICAEVWNKTFGVFRTKYPGEDWEETERKCASYAKLKMLLSTLPEREAAKAYEPILKQLSSDLLSEYNSKKRS